VSPQTRTQGCVAAPRYALRQSFCDEVLRTLGRRDAWSKSSVLAPPKTACTSRFLAGLGARYAAKACARSIRRRFALSLSSSICISIGLTLSLSGMLAALATNCGSPQIADAKAAPANHDPTGQGGARFSASSQ
jgi:hypothetical protein